LNQQIRIESPSEQMSYLPHVDGLRALAVALVVIFHAWPSALPGGFIGVDVFFVISGFIITRQIAAEMEGGRFSYVKFLGRRARRLIPAALVCCVLVTAAAIVILMPDALVSFSESLAAVWTMTANFYFYSNTGYFDGPSAEAPLLHMWSLAVEDQFYLTWPLLLFLLVRRGWSRPQMIAACTGLFALSLLHSQYAAERHPELAFYLLPSRAFELIAGCALALALPMATTLRLPRAALDLAGLALVIGSAVMLGAGVPFPGLAALPAVVGTVLLIGAGLGAPTPVSRLLSLGPVVLTGRMSYSIYLYHWPMLAFAHYWLGRAPGPWEAAGLVAAGLVLAVLSWLLVEQALTRRLGLYTADAASLVKGALAISVGATAVALVGVATRGLPQRLDEPAYQVYRAASAGNPLRPRCDGYDHAFSHERYCAFGRPFAERGSYDIAIFGDSNADHFVPMIGALAAEAGLAGRQVTQSTCAPLVGASRVRAKHQEEACTRYQETILEFLNRNPNLKIAVLASVWSSYAHVSANRVANEPDGQPRTFEDVARSTIDLFRKRGIKVLIIGQVPHFSTFSLRCLADAARHDTEEADCAISRKAVDLALSPSQSALEAIDKADPDVSFLDMRALLCTDSLCSPFKDDVLIYRDRGHLNAIGSAYLARYASLPSLSPQHRNP
jgi:peptidoglycan/LPS O-acetylase OafA/YrhL